MIPQIKGKPISAIRMGLSGLLLSGVLLIVLGQLTMASGNGAHAGWQALLALPTFVLLNMSLLALLYGLVCSIAGRRSSDKS